MWKSTVFNNNYYINFGRQHSQMRYVVQHCPGFHGGPLLIDEVEINLQNKKE